MNEQQQKHERTACPVGKFFSDLDRVFNRRSDFCMHLNQSRIEFLKAVRSLIDVRIERWEKRGEDRNRPEMSTINVE